MNNESIITYETLYEIFRKEKYQTELQKLSDNFFKEISNYLKEKESILRSQEQKDSIFSSYEIIKTKKQIANIHKILKELYGKRESKIMQLALISSRISQNNTDLSELLPEEKEFYKKILEDLNFFKSKMLDNSSVQSLEYEKPKDIKDEPETKLIKTLCPLPKFVGIDLKIYGPFEEEEIIALPIKVADLIIDKKRAEEVKHEAL